MKKTKVLMIDDNKELVTMIEEYFKNEEDIEMAFKAYDGVEGLELIEKKQEQYDLIILDLVMPKKDGLYVLEKMKKKKINKDVIVLIMLQI